MQFHNLPLQCWNVRAIRKIASKLGKPICVDNFTLERKRISYARVLIEIDTSISPLEVFEVKLPSGITYSQYVHYENLPKFCNHCFMFGHIREKCRHAAGNGNGSPKNTYQRSLGTKQLRIRRRQL